MDRQIAVNNLINAVRLVVEGLEDIGIPALKGRDHREPDWRQKQEYENALMSIVVHHFGKQRGLVRDRLSMYYPDRKAISPINIDDVYAEDEDFIAELMAFLQKVVKHGISLFGANTALQIDWALTNKRAFEWAKDYTYDLVKGIEETTRKVLQSVISQFVDTPGMTIGDVMDLLPFDEVRAQQVAVTEITRTYATANQLAGEDLKKEFPDVRVVKIWYTNNDDLVCDICAPLDGMEVDIDEFFTTDKDKSIGIDPPAHVNCRCWTETTTALAE